MIVGFARESLRPPLPFDPQGQAGRTLAVHEIDERLSITACVLRDDAAEAPVVIVGADVLAHTAGFAREARREIARVVGTTPQRVLLNAAHTHASLWPGSLRKVSGADLTHWHPGERAYLGGLKHLYADAARQAMEATVPVRASWSAGRAPDLVGNRRQPDGSGGTIIGWDHDREVDESVTVLRFDAVDGTRVGTIVGFACHPVVLGPQVERASADFVAPLRETVESNDGGLCLFLQGASGDVQPRAALYSKRGPEEVFGRRVGLEAVHAAADVDPWPQTWRATRGGRWTPTVTHRRVRRPTPPSQPVAVAGRRIRLPLGPLPTRRELREAIAQLGQRRLGAIEVDAQTNGIELQLSWARDRLAELSSGHLRSSVGAEVQAIRVGEGALVGVSAELFGSIAAAIREASPVRPVLVAGCSNGVLGYIPARDDFPSEGFEVTTAHRVYGLPAAVCADAGDRINTAAAACLADLMGKSG